MLRRWCVIGAAPPRGGGGHVARAAAPAAAMVPSPGGRVTSGADAPRARRTPRRKTMPPHRANPRVGRAKQCHRCWGFASIHFRVTMRPIMPGEFDFIVWIRAQQQSSDLVQVPAGDDLAVLKWPANDLVIVGADQVLDGVHFDSASHSPRAIGRKAMNRNLSDCAAMACLPTAAIVTVALPRAADLEFAKELYLGMQEAGDRFDCPIVGGDTGSWDEKLAV